jgi:hypothetical protein
VGQRELRSGQPHLHRGRGHVDVAVGQRLGGQAEQDGVLLGLAGPAELGGQADAQHAELAQVGEDLEGEVGGCRTVAVAGQQDLARVCLERLAERLLLLGERE